MSSQIGYFDTLKSVAGKVFAYLASITLTGTDGKTITVTQDTSLDEAVAMSSKAPKDSPSLTTPSLGVAAATSINKVAITAPETSATLTIADGKTLTVEDTSLVNQDLTTDASPTFAAVSSKLLGICLSGSGTTSAENGIATTLFAASYGMYLVWAIIDGGGASNYGAFATIVCDTATARIVANDATLMSLTLSGLDVQGKQGAGGTANINWHYLKVT